MKSTLMARLRIETRSAHDHIEEALDLDAALATVVTYRLLLTRFYVFHAGWEPVLAGLIADPNLTAPRFKLALLWSDLIDLGMTSMQIDALVFHPPLPPLTTQSQAFGAMYVLEGSTLGGQLISRQVADRLGFGAETGARYYNAYGRGVGAMWRAFGQAMEVATPRLDGDDVVTGAQTAFAQLQACLSERC